MQGILGVFLREPLLDWLREARAIKRTSRDKDAPLDEGSHVALKVPLDPCCCLPWG